MTGQRQQSDTTYPRIYHAGDVLAYRGPDVVIEDIRVQTGSSVVVERDDTAEDPSIVIARDSTDSISCVLQDRPSLILDFSPDEISPPDEQTEREMAPPTPTPPAASKTTTKKTAKKTANKTAATAGKTTKAATAGKTTKAATAGKTTKKAAKTAAKKKTAASKKTDLSLPLTELAMSEIEKSQGDIHSAAAILVGESQARSWDLASILYRVRIERKFCDPIFRKHYDLTMSDAQQFTAWCNQIAKIHPKTGLNLALCYERYAAIGCGPEIFDMVNFSVAVALVRIANKQNIKAILKWAQIIHKTSDGKSGRKPTQKDVLKFVRYYKISINAGKSIASICKFNPLTDEIEGAKEKGTVERFGGLKLEIDADPKQAGLLAFLEDRKSAMQQKIADSDDQAEKLRKISDRDVILAILTDYAAAQAAE